MEGNDEDDIQNYVDNAGDNHEDQGPLGVSDSAKDRRSVVIDHQGRHPKEIDLDIQLREIDDVLRGADHVKHRPGQKHSQYDQDHAEEEAGHDTGMDRFDKVLFIMGTESLRRQNIGSDGEAHEKRYNQIDQRAVGSDGRQSLRSRETADNSRIRGVKKQLQDARSREWQGEAHDFA